MASVRTLVCCAYPFGYGPAAKLLHIARHLQDSSTVRLVFLGHGIAHELVARGRLFADVVKAHPGDDKTASLLRSSAGVLSLMERDHSQAAVDHGRPLYVIDSLLWLRANIPPVFRRAARFFAQAFPGVNERLAEVGPAASLVGPIVGSTDVRSSKRRWRLVINLGGGEALDRSVNEDPAYCDFLVRMLSASGWEKDSVLLAGAKVIQYLRQRRCPFEMLSTPHDVALRSFGEADCVLTAPGLTATLECFALGVPTFFLPPQNFSQWRILAELRERGLAPGALHWQDVLSGDRIRAVMAEDDRRRAVCEAIQEGARNPCALERCVTGLATAMAGDPTELARRQRGFFVGLGPCGATRIAQELRQLLATEVG